MARVGAFSVVAMFIYTWLQVPWLQGPIVNTLLILAVLALIMYVIGKALAGKYAREAAAVAAAAKKAEDEKDAEKPKKPAATVVKKKPVAEKVRTWKTVPDSGPEVHPGWKHMFDESSKWNPEYVKVDMETGEVVD